MTFLILTISLALFAQSVFSVYLMLYSWEYPEKLDASKGPSQFLPPEIAFSVLLPARHEEAVIYETIKRVWGTNYPCDLLEIVVICHSDDTGTIAEAQRAIDDLGSPNVRIATFTDPPINKPRGLNIGLKCTSHEVMTIFDAEDDIDAEIFNVINTVMLQEKVGVVQAGVQLMNFRDHWFSIHNCMEYFFWFKSRLHYHARVGMIPLGGNTVFIRRHLLQRIGGWDEHCLTEDAEIGLRLSTLGEPIRVIYDMKHVTREETPPSVSSFIRQRTRWQQGFLQVLRKGSWLALPRFSQRLLAFYTLSYPIQQAILTLLWIPAVLAILWLKLPTWVALLSFLPLYSLAFQYLTTAAGAFVFTREYNLKFPLLMPLSMALTFLPYQWLLGISSLRAAFRELFRVHDWEKTAHVGAHRQTESAPLPVRTAIARAYPATVQAIIQEGPLPAQVATAQGSSVSPQDIVAQARTVSLQPALFAEIAIEQTRMILLKINAAQQPAFHITKIETNIRPVTCSSFEEEDTVPHRAIRKMGALRLQLPAKPAIASSAPLLMHPLQQAETILSHLKSTSFPSRQRTATGELAV